MNSACAGVSILWVKHGHAGVKLRSKAWVGATNEVSASPEAMGLHKVSGEENREWKPQDAEGVGEAVTWKPSWGDCLQEGPEIKPSDATKAKCCPRAYQIRDP